MIKKNRILVTGVNGYVGSHIFNYFAKKSDYVVEGIDIIEKASDSRIHIVDLRKANTTKIFFRDNKFDFIYHTAGIIEGQNISEYINGNVTTTLNLLDSLKEDKDVRIFIFGTASQYSNKYVRLVKETDKTLPVNNYGLSKKLQEFAAKHYLENYFLDLIFLRIFNIYGEGQSNNFVIPKFIDKVISCKKDNSNIKDINIDFHRDFIYVDDLVKILELLLNSAVKGEIYNIGSGTPTSINSVLKKISEFSGQDLEIFYEKAEYRETDIPYQVADISKLKSTIGEYKFTNFDEKLKNLYFKSSNSDQ